MHSSSHPCHVFSSRLTVNHPSSDPCYHQLCDNLDNLSLGPYLWNTRATADFIAQYATTDTKVFLKDPVKTTNLLKSAKPDYAADIGEECHPHLDEL